VERTLRQQRVLAESAHATVGMCLQGYLFFGSANRVVERVSRLVAPGVRHLVVDFRLVQGMDTSAQLAFTKIERICTQHAVTLVLCALGPLHAAFERAGVIGRGAVACKDLDAALEWTERRLLAEGGDATKGRPLRALLSPYFRPESLERLLFLLEAVETERGVTLFDVGGRAEPIVFVEQGVVSLSSVQPGGDRVRLGSYGPGTVLGGSELLAHGARCGWVTVEEPGRVFRLTRDKLRELERTSPAVAVELKNLLIETLSSRLAIVNQHVASL
jgi:SulP family sulfate permease